VITFFTIPKPWTGEAATLQENAIGSWRALGCRVLLLGDEPGVADAAVRLGAEHVPSVARNEYGTPLLDSAFAQAHAAARGDALCFANADIVLAGDFTAAADAVLAALRPVLMIGESWDTPVPASLVFDEGWETRLAPGRKRGAGALDWFVFTHDLFTEIPPFAVGRAAFDNWLVWAARDAGAPVVDATRRVHAVHQAHGYGHVAGGFATTRSGPEVEANWRLIGGKDRVYTRYDATHVLTRNGVRKNLGSTLRAKERARKAVWKLRHGQLLPARLPG